MLTADAAPTAGKDYPDYRGAVKWRCSDTQTEAADGFFSRNLVSSDSGLTGDSIVRQICAEVIQPSNLYVASPLRVQMAHRADEETFWELFHGKLLDGTQTRRRQRFETWGLHLIDEHGERSTEPILAIRLDAANGRLYVTRAVLCHVHETYTDGANTILTREAQRWQRELVGTVVLDRLDDAGSLRDELACLLFQAVVGASRLPLISIESPLPLFALGQIGYCFRPKGHETDPITHWSELIRCLDDTTLAPLERIKLLELSLRAASADDIDSLAGQCSARAGEILPLLRGMFNAVSLSPFTDFTAKSLALVRVLVKLGAISQGDRADFLSHLIRQLARHLAAYDLVAFHHRGANYPDALLLDEVLGELLPLAVEQPALFAGASRNSRLRRRAIRHALLLQLEYAGHPVPDLPTSPGENQRVMPEPFYRVSDDQIYSPVTRQRRLFECQHRPDSALAKSCWNDLDDDEELQELGTALFLDRPLGYAKAAGEPDQTLLVSHVLFSRTLAEQRLAILARRPDWPPEPGAIERWRRRLAELKIDGLQLRNAGPPPRPGVVSLHDALRVADDWQFLRTTVGTLRDFHGQYLRSLKEDQLGAAVPPVDEWRLLIPGGTAAEPTLCIHDRELRVSLEFAADMSRGYATRGGVEYPVAGLRRVGSAAK